MKLPSRIEISDDITQTGPQMGFGGVDERDVERQIRYLAIRYNQIIDYLHALPMIPNEIDTTTDLLTGEHKHDWILRFKMKNVGTYACSGCSEVIKKALSHKYGHRQI